MADRYLVQVVVEGVVVARRSAVRVVPPIADENLLVEDGPLGAKETVLTAVEVAIVVDLE